MYDTILQEPGYAAFFVRGVQAFLAGSLVNIATTLLTLAISWYGFWYLMLEVFCISTGITANEAFNRHRCRYLFTPFQSIDKTIKLRYNNKFSKGFYTNWVDFLTK
jgi:hypothetical protein